MTHNECKEVLRFCVAKGIGLHHVVTMLSQALDVSLGDVARKSGHNRNTLYNALKGVQNPSASLKRHVSKALGIDPWDATRDLLVVDAAAWTPSQLEILYTLHEKHRVPSRITFMLALRLIKKTKGDCAQYVNCERYQFNGLISGSEAPNTTQRKRLCTFTGFDHFAFAAQAGNPNPTKATLKTLYEAHRSLHIPTTYTTAMMGQWIGTTLTTIATTIGYPSAEVQRAIANKTRASSALRDYFKTTFHFDPWEQ